MMARRVCAKPRWRSPRVARKVPRSSGPRCQRAWIAASRTRGSSRSCSALRYPKMPHTGRSPARALLAGGELQVRVDHARHEVAEADLGRPAELLSGPARVGEEEIDLGGAEVALVDLDELVPVEPGAPEG